MGVLRKSISLSITLSYILGSTSVFAVDPNPPGKAQAPKAKESTPYSYQPNSFCSNAQGMMEKLNKENADNTEKVLALKTKIDSANAYMDVINGVDALAKQYSYGLQAIVSAQFPKAKEELEKDKHDVLTNMKTVIRNGLIINALGLLLKNNPLNKDEMFKIESICSMKENLSQPICKKAEKFSSVSLPNTPKPERAYISAWTGAHPLDQTLEAFRTAFKRVEPANQNQLKIDVETIIASIPSNIAPSAILPILDSTAPGLTALLASDESKEMLIKCLDENSSKASLAACEKLLPEVGKEKSFMSQMTTQTLSAVSAVKKLATIIEAASKANISSFGTEMEKYSDLQQGPGPTIAQAVAQTKTKVEEQERRINQAHLLQTKKEDSNKKDAIARAIENTERDKVNLQGIALLFYEPDYENASESGDVKEKNAKAIATANTKAAKWRAECLDTSKAIDITACQEKMKTINGKVKALTTNYQGTLLDLQNEMKQIDLDSNGRYTKIETLKKFVAEKYLRTCKNNPAIVMKRQTVELGIQIDGTCYNGKQNLATITSLDSLGVDLNNVILNTKYAMDISAKNDSTGTFSKNEMAEFHSVCKADNYYQNFKEICSEIGEAKVERDKVKDNKEWDEFNEKYWVSYDANSPKGYSVAKKKSNLRVFGEGFLPVVPTMIPMFFGNYAMGQNINTLTNQGLYQKQMLHTYDVYNSSPWMYNYNYFGSSAFTSTTSSTTGFNFTP